MEVCVCICKIEKNSKCQNRDDICRPETMCGESAPSSFLPAFMFSKQKPPPPYSVHTSPRQEVKYGYYMDSMIFMPSICNDIVLRFASGHEFSKLEFF